MASKKTSKKATKKAAKKSTKKAASKKAAPKKATKKAAAKKKATKKTAAKKASKGSSSRAKGGASKVAQGILDADDTAAKITEQAELMLDSRSTTATKAARPCARVASHTDLQCDIARYPQTMRCHQPRQDLWLRQGQPQD